MSFEALIRECDAGSGSAMNLAAMYFVFGLYGTVKNFEAALDWIKKAAALQHEIAFHNLSCIYRHGILGCEKNEIKANYWMDQAIKVGNQHFIKGMTLMQEKKFSKAVQNFEVAANKFLCSASMHFLGRLHLRGEHVPKDIEKENRYLNCAANMGCLAAVVEIQGAQKLQISKNDACGGCGKWAQNFCSRCKSQKYCSVQCQLQAWSNHKSDCAASIFEMD